MRRLVTVGSLDMNTIHLTDAEAQSSRADRLLDALEPGELHGVSVHGGAVAIALGAPRPTPDGAMLLSERRPMLLTH